MKVLMGFYQLESNENVRGLTELDSFNIKFGDSLMNAMHVKDIFSKNGIETIPAVYANGHAATVLSKEGYEYIKSKFLRSVIENLHDIDGIYLFLHGASKVEALNEGSGERQLLKEIREVTGPYLPIFVVMDPHGNLTENYVNLMTYGRCYRHSPHTDIIETYETVAKHMIEVLKNKRNIKPVYRKLPFVLGGERSVSTDEPMISINRYLNKLEEDERIMSASFHVGYLRHDNYATGSGLIIVPSDTKFTKYAEEEIEKLYEYCVSKYEQFTYHGKAMETIKAINYSIESDKQHLVVTDSGDNVTSGSPGTGTKLLRKYLELDTLGDKKILFAAITDTKLFHKLINETRKEYFKVDIGENLNDISKPVNLEVKIIDKGNLQQIFGVTDNYGETITLKVKDKDIHIILIDKSISFAEMHQFNAANINLKAYNIIVVKQGYIFPELKEFTDDAVMALTPGPTNQKTESLIFKQIQRPMLPFDEL